MSNFSWIGNSTILYRGRIAEIDSCEDGWAVYRAMQKIDSEIDSEISKIVEERVKAELEKRSKDVQEDN